MRASEPPAGSILLIVDANVLIDYALSDSSILALAVRHLGSVFVPLPVLEEVRQLTRDDCDRLGITLLDPTLEELSAASSRRGSLSFEDELCLLLARTGGFTCVTNDKTLRRACEQAGVPVRWGLELMVELVSKRELTVEAAITTARAIRSSNPVHITEVILERFEARIRSTAHRNRDT